MERRRPRPSLKVIHRHRVADRKPFMRVSELVFVGSGPKAVIDWINLGGVRTPLYLLELDPAQLRHPASGPRDTWYYGETTVDPRFVNVAEQKNDERGMRFELMSRSG